MFGVAKETVRIIVNEVCQATVMVLPKKYVKTSITWQICIRNSETNCGIPQCSGVVQLTGHTCLYQHCRNVLRTTIIDKAFILSSCKLQQTSDADLLIFTIGWPGSVHDAWVFINSVCLRRRHLWLAHHSNPSHHSLLMLSIASVPFFFIQYVFQKQDSTFS